jgi:hypothetical protein
VAVGTAVGATVAAGVVVTSVATSGTVAVAIAAGTTAVAVGAGISVGSGCDTGTPVAVGFIPTELAVGPACTSSLPHAAKAATAMIAIASGTNVILSFIIIPGSRPILIKSLVPYSTFTFRAISVLSN